MALTRRTVQRPSSYPEEPETSDIGSELDDPHTLARGQKRPATPAAASGSLDALVQAMARTNALLYANLIASGGPTPTDFPVTINGANVPTPSNNTAGQYVPLWLNNLGRVVTVRVVARFAVPGGRVKLSRLNDLSDRGKISELALSGIEPNGTMSDWIPLRHNETVWISLAAQGDGTFAPLSTADLFHVQVFDPTVLIPR